MKTSVELNREKVALAKKLGHSVTLKDLLDRALDAYIAEARRHAMADILGTGFFEGNLETMRERNGRTRR